MATAMRFRRADPSDLPELYSIASEAASLLPYQIPVDKDSIEAYVDQYMGPSKYTYVLDNGDTIHAVFGLARGVFWFNRDEEFAQIDFLFTRPESRQMDVAKHLMRFLRETLKIHTVMFGFDSGGRVEAKDRFFRRFGFERTGYNYVARKVD